MGHWFPRFSPNGLHLADGDTRLTIDGVDRGPGRGPVWLTPDTVLFSEPGTEELPTGMYILDLDDFVFDGAPVQLNTRPTNWVDANGKGAWVACTAGEQRCVTNDGRSFPGFFGGGKVCAISEEGWIALGKNSDGSLWLVPPPGAGTAHFIPKLLDGRPCRNPRFTRDALVWEVDTPEQHSEIAGITPLSLSGPIRKLSVSAPEGYPVPVWHKGELYVMSFDNERLMLRKWGQTQGWVLAEGVTHTPDVISDGEGFLAVFTAAGGGLGLTAQDPTLPTIDLSHTPVAPPRVTITSYEPIGEAPFLCSATYAAEAGSGPIVLVDWEYFIDNSWELDAQNPASDPDHTYHFRTPGTYYIRLTAIGPGGHATTRSERKVTVTVPETPKIPTSAFRLDSGYLLCADQFDSNLVNATRQGSPRSWESFVVEPLGGGQWSALKTDTGYVAQAAVGHELVGNSAHPMPLRIIEFAPGQVALMVPDGGYIWAGNAGGGKVLCNGSRIDGASTFALIPGEPKEAPAPPPVNVVPGDPAADINTNFLALEGYGYVFMSFGEPLDKFERILDQLRAKGHTHIPTGIWGSYPGLPSFNFRNDVAGFRDRFQRCLAKGITPIVFGHTDGTQWTLSQVKQFQRDYFPKIADLTTKFSLGWEFNSIDGLRWTRDGYAQLELFALAKELLPNARRYGHWTPERWAGGPDQIGSYTGDEYGWWAQAKARGAHGMLYNDNNPSLTTALERYHRIPAPHGYGPGIVGRMVGMGLDCVAFEMSRGDLNRFRQVVAAVLGDGRSKGWG